jgi:condensin complex subunit 1
MRDFVLPYKPEELLAQPEDDRLWASNLPDVENWSQDEADEAMNAITRRVLKTQGRDLAEDKSFSMLFALLQAWSRLEEAIHARTAELLTDALHRLSSDAARLKKAEKDAKGKELKTKEKEAAQKEIFQVRTASKVAIFFLRLMVEKSLKVEPVRKRRKNAAQNEERERQEEEAKERMKILERQRCSLLLASVESIGKAAMPWLWISDAPSWQQVAEKVSDCGFLVLDSEQALKHKETRTMALRCIVEPLQQEGHDHSNLLVASVSKLTHGLRGHELAAPFAADCVAMAHNTPLPRSLLVELTQICTGGDLASQGAFQRSLGNFISALADRLPHLVMANISVLLELLNVDCYPLRSAMVESIGSLLLSEGRTLPRGARCGGRAAEGADGEDAQGEEGDTSKAGVDGQGCFHIAIATKKELLDTLLTRSTDKTVWVRVQTLRTITNLVQSQKAMPKELWPRILQIVAKRMQDSACSARKSALSLMHALIKYHPYGPTLKGTGDERAKTEQILKYIGDRKAVLLQEAQAAELKEAEEMLQQSKVRQGGEDGEEEGTEDPELPTSQAEPVMKRRRLGKKTQAADTTMEYEVDKALQADAEDGEAACDKRNRELKALEDMETCYADRFKFTEMLDMTEARLRALLISRTASDVTEGIGVVVELKRRGLPAAARAFNQILSLVWSKHTNVKDAAVEAFFSMHLEGRTGAEAVHSLLDMYQEGAASGSWTYTHLASVSELIEQAAAQQRIEPVAAIQELVRAMNGPACPMALRTLTALCSHATALTKALPQIAQLFGPKGTSLGVEPAARLQRVRLCCLMLQRYSACVKPQLNSESPEFGHVWQMLQQAIQVIFEAFAKGDIPPDWFGALQAAMDLSFDLSALATERSPAGLGCPDKHWERILEAMLCGVLHKLSASPSNASPGKIDSALADGDAGEQAEQAVPMDEDEGDNQDDQDGDDSRQIAQAGNSDVKASASQLSCLMFMAGHFALRMVIYMEMAQGLLKKKRMATEDARMAEAREKKKDKQQAKPKKGKKGSKAQEGEDEEKDDDEAESAGMGMAGQEEREAEHFADMIETRILYNTKSALSKTRPLILKGLVDPQMRTNPVLRRVAAISLCKFATVSKRFCQEHLQLIFSVLFPKAGSGGLLASNGAEAESAVQDSATRGSGAGALLEDLTLRQSLLVAVGDLLFRHPNVVEPWTDRLYNALGAPTGGTPQSVANAMDLRLTALLVLTHLVLNDMMKPRAVFLTRALWLTACPHESTARVARILFQELSKRSTAIIYNLMPQVLSELADQKEGARERESTSSAEDRVAWVMQFVEKEKHIEGLIEKLSVRLEQAADIKGMGKDGCQAKESSKEGEGEDAEDEDNAAEVPVISGAEGQLETVSCLAHALGAMNYSDRCIIRLHDVIVVRKGLNTAISYHQVVRDCLLGVIEKTRKPRFGKGGEDKGEAQPAEDGAGGSKANAAASKAVDEIEQIVNKLGAKKKKDVDFGDCEPDQASAPVEPQGIPTPHARAVLPVQEDKKKAKAGKRKQEEADDEPGFEDEAKGRRGRKAKAPAASAADEPSLAARMAAPAAPVSTAPAVEKVKSGGEELRAALQAQKEKKRLKGKGKGKASRTVDDDDA